ncbi:uncharacterized protein TrAtP1_009974 [Trichoderma atroviride]|uniref:uncharacterized protein n=1 Tax=Hypocrea atroviridis TaxID=63577 RepID=UPI00332C6203|nr:hypothetical protein TrAtP1_009974 [Trichoderma atroviride]
MRNRILDTGISVAYEPENGSPIVDIVFIHGLHGHPFKSWAYHLEFPGAHESSATSPVAVGKHERGSVIHRVAVHLRRKSLKAAPMESTESASATDTISNGAQGAHMFWPGDLLPKQCPDSRILMFGYDGKITKYAAGAINQNSILAHSKDLLFALCRERGPNRPLIFVAHSLGGIIVKEMLAQSSTSVEPEYKSIVECTAKIVFLGTPHRGSQDVAALGEVARSIISALGMETTPTILDALGLKSSDLNRAQEEFSKLWQEYDFQVKTFQEGLSLAKLGKKIVPDYSSSIGDHREHSETLQANHQQMCRYSGTDDPNYRKVAGELCSIYSSLARLNSTKPRQSRRAQSVLSATSSGDLLQFANDNQVNDTCLESLWFPAINTRYQNLERPADKTCSWLFSHKLYQEWFNGNNRQETHGLLWLKGKPGSGKSILMKEAFRQAVLEQDESNYHSAAFFFCANGNELERSCLGLFKSLLYQLLPGDRVYLQRFQKIWDKQKVPFHRMGTAAWQEGELEFFFRSMFMDMPRKRTMPRKKTIIFIDAVDECEGHKVRSMIYFWRNITSSVYFIEGDLNVCLSSRHFRSITFSNCPEIIIEQHNSHDIATFVDHKFQLGIATQPQWELLRDQILEKSAGVFLWVALVVEDVLKSWDDGYDMPLLIKKVQDVPDTLRTLFSNMLSNLDSDVRELTVKFFQWAILATAPLRLHEWHHVMAFIRQPTLGSLNEWRQSVNFTDNDDQLEKQIRNVSRGLVEVKKVGSDESQDNGIEEISVYAGAGSLNLENGNTRIVQVIHESVRDFFLLENGFFVLDSNLYMDTAGIGHLSIMNTCLDYLNIAELDALVEARIRAAGRKNRSQLERRLTSNFAEDICSTNSWSYGSLERHRDPIINNKGLPQYHKPSMKSGEDKSVLAMLNSFDYAPNVDIVEWMKKGHPVSATSSSPHSFTHISLTHSSEMSQPQRLKDYPALLSYATAKLFTHAKLADELGVDPSPIVERLNDGTTWARWVALKEDIPEGTTVLTYAANRGISSWAKAIPHEPTAPPFHPRLHLSFERETDPIAWRAKNRDKEELIFSGIFDDSKIRPDDLPIREFYHRPQSVESFGSASSHGSSHIGRAFDW